MGNPGNPNPRKPNPRKPKYDPSIQHFSHDHQLQLLNIKDQPALNLVSCAGCKLQPSEWVYACKPCNFILHIPCSQMPKLIHHPADPNHTFTLLAQPAYPTGLFRCDACGNKGDGFNYHCSTCGIDIHILCATKPLCVTHQTHRCPLNLAFSPPYPSKDFSCGVCRGHGSDQWVYRCNPCGFDAHLHCATTKPSPSPSAPPMSSQYQTRTLVHPQSQSPLYQQPQPQIPIPPISSQYQTRSLVQPQPPIPLYQQPQAQIPFQQQQYVQPAGVSTAEQARQNFMQNYMAAQQADQARIMSMIQRNNGGINVAQMQSLMGVNSATNAVTQQYLQGMLGGNNGGINSITQQFMQGMFGGGQQADPNPLAGFMGGMNGSGGGAGQQFNQDFMQNFLGGGNTGGQDFMQNFLGGGNSGGQDFLQNIMGGGNGGGEDFLQNIMGGGADAGGIGFDGASSLMNMFGGN